MQDVYWEVLLGPTHVEGKGRRQGWAKGEVELRYIVSTEASAGHTGSWNAPQSCLKLGEPGLCTSHADQSLDLGCSGRRPGSGQGSSVCRGSPQGVLTAHGSHPAVCPAAEGKSPWVPKRLIAAHLSVHRKPPPG